MQLIIYFSTVLAIFSFFIMSYSAIASETEIQQPSFLSLYKQLKKGEMEDFLRMKQQPSFKQHVLYPYLAYEYFKQNIATATDKDFSDFIKIYQPSLLANRIYQLRIRKLAEQNNWQAIVNHYKPDVANTLTKCLYYEAFIRIKPSKSILIAAETLWMVKKTHPKACDSLFKLLKMIQKPDTGIYWKRFHLSLQKNWTTKANQLIAELPQNEQNLAKLWLNIHKQPEKNLKNPLLQQNNTFSQHVIAHAIVRIARKNSVKASRLWHKYRATHTFSDKMTAKVKSYLGVKAARKHQMGALVYLASIPAELRSNEANVWMARMALRQSQWTLLLNAINAMEEKEKQRDIWRYWTARALQTKNQMAQANVLYAELAQNASFYGFLSADHLKQRYNVLRPQNTDRRTMIAQIKRMPSLRRALAWFALKQNVKATREWNWTLKQLDKAQKLALAEIALKNGQSLLAIIAVAKTKQWNELTLRFPMFYQNLIQNNATQQSVDPAWIYAIIRRESIFQQDVVSPAKALGLMQLLPSTARGVAKNMHAKQQDKLETEEKKALKRLSKTDILKPATNIKLGTGYLKTMLKKFKGNYAKATAAYNAGPGRIPRWLPDETIQADQWVESIPFTETRKYVRAVMTYLIIYDYKLDTSTVKRLSYRLQPIKPAIKTK